MQREGLAAAVGVAARVWRRRGRGGGAGRGEAAGIGRGEEQIGRNDRSFIALFD